jgi:hypothetical protein
MDQVYQRMKVERASPLKRARTLLAEQMLTGAKLEEIQQKEAQRVNEEGNPIGSLQRHFDFWNSKEVECSQVVLDYIRNGVRIVFADDAGRPPEGEPGRPNYVPAAAMEFANAEMTRMFLMNVIEGVSDKEQRENPGYVMPIGGAPKSGNKWRLVVDATDQGAGPNAYMIKKGFKMEHIDDLLNQMGRNWYGLVFDLRAGFHHVLVRPEDRKWLRFMWGGKMYQFRSMPFGPRHSPYYFSKIVREFIRILRRGCVIQGCTHEHCRFRAAPQGITIISYVDDFCVAAKSREQLLRIRDEILVPLMKDMGWIRALEKGAWEPSQIFQFLGLEVNTVKGLVLIPEDKLEKYTSSIERLLRKQQITPRELSAVAGKIVSVLRAFAPGLVYLRSSFRLIAQVTEGGITDWDKRIEILEEMREDLTWLSHNLKKRNGHFAWRPANVVVLATDASQMIGWGATLRIGKNIYKAQGNWTAEESKNHEEWIYILEMKAILLAVKAFRTHLRGHNIQIVTDNMICRHTVPAGSRIPELSYMIKEIYDEISLAGAMLVDTVWIRSEDNTESDHLSRYVDVNDWQVKDWAWNVISQNFPDLDVDRFATRENTKLPRYNTRWAHPESDQYNALAQDWRGTFSYACPPMAMVPKVLS